MSQDELHGIAQRESPREVEIPNTWQGLVVWAIAKFGVGIAVAGVFGWAVTVIYADLRRDRDQLMNAYRDNITVMQVFTQQIENLENTIDEAHRRAVAP